MPKVHGPSVLLFCCCCVRAQADLLAEEARREQMAEDPTADPLASDVAETEPTAPDAALATDPTPAVATAELADSSAAAAAAEDEDPGAAALDEAMAAVAAAAAAAAFAPAEDPRGGEVVAAAAPRRHKSVLAAAPNLFEEMKSTAAVKVRRHKSHGE